MARNHPVLVHRRLLSVLLMIPLFASTILILCSASLLSAATFTAFGPESFTRGSGSPVTESRSFAVADANTEYTIRISNGGLTDGEFEKVSSSIITLNGVQIVGPEEFNQNVTVVEKPVTLAANNEIGVELRGQPGGGITIEILGTNGQAGNIITITSPAPGAEIAVSVVLVRGTVQSAAGQQVGITVNGASALVEGNQFTALVPVDPNVTSLTATAADFTGILASDTIPVTVTQPASESVMHLFVDPPGGLAPLTIGFSLSSLVSITQLALDLQGDGLVDFQGASLDGQLFTYSEPGIFTPTVQATDSNGQVHTAITLVQVSDQLTLDNHLQAVWQGLKEALRSGDVTQAASFIHSDTRSRYQDQFGRFSLTTLANIDQYMTTIQLVEVGFAGAQYEMLRVQNGQTFSFAVWFQIDQDGLWRGCQLLS